MRLLERMQANPTINALVWLGGIVGTVVVASVGGAFAADARYVKKEEVQAVAQQTDKATKELKEQIEYNADVNRKRQLEDNIFKYNLIPEKQRTQADKAMAERYKQERQDLIEQWQRQGKPLR